MVERNKQTFLQGALILVIASVLVKILGAFFKIPLTMMLKADGMGLFNTSYTLYAFFVLAAKGLSVAVSKMVSESASLGKIRESDRIFSVAFVILGIIGIMGSGLLYFGADVFAAMLGNTRASITIKAIAPSVLFVTLVSALRGFFQGKQNMYPTAFSEVIEALGKLVIGILLAWWLIKTSIEYAAAGAVLGVTSSTFVSLIFILAIYIFGKRRSKLGVSERIRTRRSIAKELLLISLPITIGASVASLTNVVDMMTIMNRLQSITQVTPEFFVKYSGFIELDILEGTITAFDGAVYEELANKLYGLYSGYAVTLFNLPLTMVVALSTSVLPAISGALKRNNTNSAKNTTQSVLRITVLFSLPCAVGLSVLSGPVLKLIFNDSLAQSLLSVISVAIVFVSLVQVTNAILQAYGRMHIPVINMIIGCIIKIVMNYYLISIPSINIDGAPISTLACYFIIAALNFIYIIKITGCKFNIGELVIKPLISAGGMGVIVVFAMNMLLGTGLDARYAVMPAIALGGIVYVMLVFLVGAVRESDVAMMPKGESIVKILKKIHLLK